MRIILRALKFIIMKNLILLLTICIAFTSLYSQTYDNPEVLYEFDVEGTRHGTGFTYEEYGENNYHRFTLVDEEVTFEQYLYTEVEDENVKVPGSIVSISTNGNGHTVIQCSPSQATCFEYRIFVKNDDTPINVGIINSNQYDSKNLILSTNLNFAITGSNELTGTFSGDEVYEHEVSNSALLELEGREGFYIGGYIYGIINDVYRSGNTYVISCYMGPGWCVKYAKPYNSVVSDYMD